jgi:hypothetical protein
MGHLFQAPVLTAKRLMGASPSSAGDPESLHHVGVVLDDLDGGPLRQTQQLVRLQSREDEHRPNGR